MRLATDNSLCIIANTLTWGIRQSKFCDCRNKSNKTKRVSEINNNNRPIIFSNESGCVSLCDSWQTSGRSIFLYREPACVVWVIYYYESIDVRLYRCAGQNKKRKQMRKDIENIPSRSRHCISSFLNYRYYIFPYRKWFKNLLIGNSASD